MRGRFINLVKYAGRHFLQLWKNYFLVRVLLLVTMCGGIIFLSSKGLGQQPQTFTAFSGEKKNTASKAGFVEVKGLKSAMSAPKLNNPFAEPSEQGGEPEKSPPKKVVGVSVADKNKEKSDSKQPSRTIPVLKGILTGNERVAAIVEDKGSQYILYPGDRLESMKVESIDEDTVTMITEQGRKIRLKLTPTGCHATTSPVGRQAEE